MNRRHLALVSLLLFPALVRAQDPPEDPPSGWGDPSLEDALATAHAVVRAKVVSTEPEPRVQVLGVISGDVKEGELIGVFGTRAGPALDALMPPLRKYDEAIFILRLGGPQEKPRAELPTPSFGRFPVRGNVVVAAVRDSFVRIDMAVAAYEDFLKNAQLKARGGKPDTAWVDSCRKTLASLDPTQGEALVPSHVALEGLCYGAEEKDTDGALRFLACPKFQVRLSAVRVLQRAGGERAGAALLRCALDDKDPAVRSTAILALKGAKPIPANTIKDLVSHLKSADAEPITLSTGAEDPRGNELESPFGACLETLRALGGGAEASTVCIDLLGKDDMNVLAQCCLHLVKMKDKQRVPEIVKKMRGKDNPFTGLNELIADTLEDLTGEKLGPDPEAWKKWLADGGKK